MAPRTASPAGAVHVQTSDVRAAGSRVPGTCNMKGLCGKPSLFSPELPCAVDEEPADEPDAALRERLVDVCGPAFADGPVCCGEGQVETLAGNLEQAAPLIASCPACANNFRHFWCSFTCSPHQSEFLDVAETQDIEGRDAVKRVNYFVSDQFRQGFFGSCKNVQFGATNGYAMDLIGGGARSADDFLAYMGQERPLLGSPFQIDFPHYAAAAAAAEHSTPSHFNLTTTFAKPPPKPFDDPARNCSEIDLGSRCACVDCPDVCTSLPDVPVPSEQQECKLFAWPCSQLAIVLIYFFILALFYVGFQWKRTKHADKHHLRTRGRHPAASAPSATAGVPDRHELVEPATSDASSDADADAESAEQQRFDGDEALNPLQARQPRSHAISRWLSKAMYKIGLASASNPFETFTIACLVLGVANLGWLRFTVETDPVRLWVAPNSTAKNEKDFFDQQFGPFYKTEQIFVTDKAAKGFYRLRDPLEHDNAVEDFPRVLNWDRLRWWADVEAEIRAIKAGPNETTFQDVCFAPSGPGGPCVVESIMGYFDDDLDRSGVTKKNWRNSLNQCAWRPAECLPSFSQPLKPNLILGGIPIEAPPSEARALVGTWIVANSLDPAKLRRAEVWEKALQEFLLDLSGSKPQGQDGTHHPLAVRAKELGLHISFSTGVSLEEEISSSTNTDVGIVILSYLLMLLYASTALGGGYTPGRRVDANGRSVPTTFLSDLKLALSLRPRGIRLPEGDSDGSEYGAQDARAGARARLCAGLFVRSKVTLGLFGIAIVLVAISSAVGVWSALGVRVTLVIAEVIPFLVLAVGVDNIFLLSNEMDRQNTLASTSNPYYHPAGDAGGDEEARSGYGAVGPTPAFHLSAEERAARALARVGPSIVLSVSIQVSAFLLGALVPMPAVRNFALYAAASMLIAAAMHLTVFVAALALDARRTESNRVDCLPCVRARTPPHAQVDELSISSHTDLVRESWLGTFMRETYAPFIVRPSIKRAVLALFILFGAKSIMITHRINMGLDQRLALPPDSYLRDYFDSIDTWLDVGPPVYFVEWRSDTKFRYVQRQLCARFTTCAPFSVANTLEGERKRPESSYIVEPAASWIDDFFQWLNPAIDSCCRVRKNDPSRFCTARDSEFSCRPCFEGREYNTTLQGLPEGDEFMMFLRQWLKSPTSAECPLGGAASYGSAISLKRSNLTVKEPLLDKALSETDTDIQPEMVAPAVWAGPRPGREDRKLNVYASHFRTSHVPLRSQADFIEALKAARRIAEDISDRSGVRLFAYSLFHPFFDQYLYLPSLTVQVLGSAALAIVAISTAILGDWRTALTVLVCVASTILGVVGYMGKAGIELNALTLVNLSVCAAIGVEFCAHVAKAFTRAPSPSASSLGSAKKAQRARDRRVVVAVGDVGASVVTGITGTKLVGLSVLWFTRSELLKLYYAQMWLALIVLGAAHGLILLPVLLSFFGGASSTGAGPAGDGDDEGEVRRRLLRAQDSNAYRAFADDGPRGDAGDDE